MSFDTFPLWGSEFTRTSNLMVVQHFLMAPPDIEPENLGYLWEEGLDEAMNYESDTDFIGPNDTSLIILTGEDDSSRAPSSFSERVVADTLTTLCSSADMTSMAAVNTKPLDKQQQQLVVERKAQSAGPKLWLSWQAKDSTSLDHPRWKNVSKRLLAASYLSGLLSLRSPRQKTSLRERYLQSCVRRWATPRYALQDKREVHQPQPWMWYPSFLPQAKRRVKRITHLSDGYIEQPF